MNVKKLIGLFIWALPFIAFGQPGQMLNFSFSIPAPATVSAGVYKGDVLIRTLFSNKKYSAGTHTESWAALDDNKQPLNDTKGLTVRVLSNNVRYEWEGVIGNTSDSATGNSVYHNYGPIKSMAFSNDYGYYAVGYNERKPSYGKFKITTPNQRIIITDKYVQADYVATDGKVVYWGCSDPYIKEGFSFVFATKTSDDSEVAFASGNLYKTKTISSNFHSIINASNGREGFITGLAVQKNGPFLFVSRKGMNRLDIINKLTGARVASVTINNITDVATDNAGNLWAITNNEVKGYQVGTYGNLNAFQTFSEIKEPSAIAVNPGRNTLLILDKATSQVFAYEIANKKLAWTLGKKGGYGASPLVADDKFYLKDAKNDFQTFLCYQPGGSFWVSDPGNTRVQLFGPDRKFLTSIAYRPISYSTFIDKNDPKRVFSDYCEYERDYSKKLAPNNGSWKLVRNWGYPVAENNDDKYGRLKNVTTLSNGRTYALGREGNATIVWELPREGNLRKAGVITGDKYDLYEDGTLRSAPNGVAIGKPMVWKERPLLGFDADANPMWGKETVIDQSPPYTPDDPSPRNIRSQAEVTSSGILIAYDGATPLNGTKKNEGPADRGFGFHLAGIKDGHYLWRTAMATHLEYKGDFPEDGSFDIGNGVVRTGDVKHHAVGRNVFYGQHGEFYKGGQTNEWNHFWDNGLLVGHFGTSSYQVKGEEAPYGMAGNALTGNAVMVNGNIYLTMNDETYHSGIHFVKISNLGSIKEEVLRPSFNSFAGRSGNSKALMKGLPHNKELTSDLNGWKRTPANDILADNLRNFWQVRTSVKSHGEFKDPDISVTFRQQENTSATVSKDLGSNKSDHWKLSGMLNYDGNYASTDTKNAGPLGEGGQFFEVLDKNGKVLFRFFPLLNYKTKEMRLIANNIIIAAGDQSEIETVTDKFQPFQLELKDGKMKFGFADYPVKTIPLFDGSADWREPSLVRFYFWTNTKNARRQVSFKDFDFHQ